MGEGMCTADVPPGQKCYKGLQLSYLQHSLFVSKYVIKIMYCNLRAPMEKVSRLE